MPNASMVLAGTALNASLVGANTVNGPAPFRVSVKPADCTKPFRVLSVGSAAMVSATLTGLVVVAQPDITATKVATRAVRREAEEKVVRMDMGAPVEN